MNDKGMNKGTETIFCHYYTYRFKTYTVIQLYFNKNKLKIHRNIYHIIYTKMYILQYIQYIY